MKKAKQWVVVALVASMALSQTVYAQEYAAPEATETVQATEAVQTVENVEETVEETTEEIPVSETIETTAPETEAETKSEDVSANQKLDEKEAMEQMQEGENAFAITEGGSQKMMAFTPSESGKYLFYSVGSDDTKATLYSGNGDELASDDASGENNNFRIRYTLEKGQTYYLAAWYYDSDYAGTITVYAERVSNKCGDNAEWSLSEDGTLTITGEGTLNNQKPWDGETIKKIVIEEGITEIPDGLFQYNEEVKELQLPESLKSIGEYAFEGCGLKGIIIPASVETIGEYAFGYDRYDTKLDDFYIIGQSGSAAENYAKENDMTFYDADSSTVPISVCNVTIPRLNYYEGKAVTPEVKVTFGSKELEEGTDYTVSYADNTSAGQGKVTITGIGKYTGSIERTFVIVECKTYTKKLTPGKVRINQSNHYYDEDDTETFIWCAADLNNMTVESDNPSVCEVVITNRDEYNWDDSLPRQYVTFRLLAYKTGKAVITFKDADGTELFKYEVEVVPQPSNAIVFEDAVLQSMMVSEYDSDENGYITEDELSATKWLTIPDTYDGEQIHSLKGIENFKNLYRLSLRGCSGITDFSVLSQLPKLEKLYFTGGSTENLSWLAGCGQLKELFLSNSKIGSWSGLEKGTGLTSLGLSETDFSDADAPVLNNLTNLESLILDDNAGFTDIQLLAGLQNLKTLSLNNTGVSDEDKWNFENIPDSLEMRPGDTVDILKYQDLINIEINELEGEDIIKTTYGSENTVSAVKPGTTKIHVVYTDALSKDITIHIGELEDQTLGDDYPGTAEIKKVDGVSDDQSINIAHILDSNGSLWTTSPELKKVQSGVKQYVADYVYTTATSSVLLTKKYIGFYLDNNNVLWSDDHQKIAEDITEVSSGGALDSKGNFYDLHLNQPEGISNVVKWASGSAFTMILKTDGSVWARSVYNENETYCKLSDDVSDIVCWNYYTGAYLKKDGTIVKVHCYTSGFAMEEFDVNAAEFGVYNESYYAKDGKLYLLGDNGEESTCVGNVKAADMCSSWNGDEWFWLILGEDGSLYKTDTLGGTLEKIDSDVTALNPNYHGYELKSWHYQKNGKYYCIKNDGSIEELTQVMLKYAGYYYLYNTYNDRSQAIVKLNSDFVYLDHVTDIWTDQGKTYALRTDGSVWDITNSPTKIGSLSDKHEHTVVTDAAVEATLDSPGKTEGSHCSECGEIITAQKSTVVTVPLTAAKANAKGGVDVSWKKVSYADGYLVYRKSGKDNWKRAAELKSADDNSWTDTTGTVGTAYTYTVRAYMNADGETVTGGFDSKGVTATVLPATVVLKSAADNGKNGIAVNWEKVTGATGYRIYRKTAGTGWKGLATVASDSTTNYTDNSVTAGTTYSYTVRAYKTVNGTDVYGGFDNTGVSASVKKSDQALGTVVLDKVTDSTRGGVILSWKAVDGAEGYRIFKKFTGSSWQKVTDVTADKLSYEDASGVTGKTYTYTVRAYKMVNGKEVLGGFDSKGLTAKKLPAKVTLKEAKADNNGAITVRWNKLSTATGYRVYRKEAGGSWKGLTTLTANTVTSYTDKAVTVGKSYTYTVRAYKAYEGQTVLGSFDADGKTATAKAAVAMPSTVKLVSVSAAAGRKITVSWEKADNCEGYVVYRKEAGKSWTRIAKAGGSNLTSYTDSTGTAGTTYTYTVRAYKTVNGKEVMGSFDANGVSALCKN